MAQNVANQGYNVPQQGVAGLGPDQLSAFQSMRDAQGVANPYLNQAAAYTNQSAQPISAGQVQNYLNPYAQYALSGLNETLGVQNRDLQGQLTQAAGGVGGDRVAVGQGEKFRQDQLARGQLMSSLYQPALSAAQADAGRQANAGYAMGNLGMTAQNSALTGANAVLGAGNQQQQQQQNLLNSLFNQQTQQQQYNLQMPQYLAGISQNLNGVLGGTTTGQSQSQSTPAQPSILSQIAGGLMSGVGLIGGTGGFGANGWLTGGGGTGKGGGSGFIPGSTPEWSADGQRYIGTRASGGAVEPSMAMRGFAEGGDTFDDRFGNMPPAVDMSQEGFTPANPTRLLSAAQPPAQTAAVPMPPVRPQQPEWDPAPTEASGARSMAMPPVQQGGGDRTAGLMPSMPEGEMPYPEARARNSGTDFARSPWLALLQTGLATMGGTSPFAGVNIGKGGLEGVKVLENQRKEAREEESVNQRAKQLWQDAQKHLDTYRKPTAYQEADLSQRKALLDKQLKQLELEGLKPQKYAEDPNTGLDLYAVRDPKTNQLIDILTGKPVGPQAGGNAPIVPTQSQIEQQAKPSEPPPLGMPEFKPDLTPTKNTAPQMMKGPFASSEAQNIKAIDAQMNKSRDGLDTQRDQLTRMKMNFATLTKEDGDGFFKKMLSLPGAPGDIDTRLKAMNAANTAAAAAKKPPVFDPAKIAAMEEITKINKTMGFTFASTISPREAVQGQIMAISAQPGLMQSPQGMQRLIGLYDGMLNAGEARHAFWSKWKQTNPRTATGWDDDFRQKNPMEKFTVRALVENTPFQQAVPALPKAVEWLRANKGNPAEVAKFDKLYNGTSSYFLTGKLDPYAAIR